MRHAGLDVLRGLAAFAVLAAHTNLESWHITGHHVGWLAMGGYGVDLFFVLSAFLITQSWERVRNLRVYALARIARIVPPYWAAISMALAFALVNNNLGTIWSGIWDVGLHLVFIHNFHPDALYSINPVFWSLGVEAQWYLLVPFFVWIVARQHGKWALLGLVILSSVLRWIWFTPELVWLTEQFIGFSAAFVAGTLAAKNPRVWAPLALLSLPMLIWGGMGVPGLSQIFGENTLPAISAIYRPLLAASFAGAVAFVASIPPHLGSPLSWLGAISYSLYLTHVPILITFSQFLPKSLVGFWASATAICLLGAALFWWVFERPAEAASKFVVKSFHEKNRTAPRREP